MKMKKSDLAKAIGISFLVFVVLSWLIPAGSYSQGTFTAGELSPIGIYDLVKIVLGLFGNYSIYGLIFLLIGGLYGVMNKTGVYSKLVQDIAKKFKGKEKRFLTISIVLFAILSSVSGFNLALFIIVPLFVAIIMTLGYDKLTAVFATVGAILVGNIGSTYGFEISGYLNLYYGLNVHADIFVKLIFLAILILLTVLFVHKSATLQKVTTTKKKETKAKTTTKKTKKDEKEDKPKKEVVAEKRENVIPLYTEQTNKKKSYMPLAIVFGVLFILLLVGLYNFKYAFNVNLFEDLYNSVTSFKIANFPIFKYLLGTMNPFGSWNLGEIAFTIVLASLVIGWLYSLKIGEIVDSFIEGLKQMVWVAVIAVFANIIMYLVLPSSQTGLHSSIFITMSNFFLTLTKGFNWFTTGIVGFIGSFFYNDFKYLVDGISATTTTLNTDAGQYSAIAILLQSIHGIVMLLAPTSVILMAGLAYMKVSLKEWIKYIWKFLLELLVISIVIIGIMLMFA